MFCGTNPARWFKTQDRPATVNLFSEELNLITENYGYRWFCPVPPSALRPAIASDAQ
jgi:hypothetical protein